VRRYAGGRAKTTVYLKDMGDFPMMNEVFGRYSRRATSARKVEAPGCGDVKVEIDAIAAVGS